jgi:hypothetical protein
MRSSTLVVSVASLLLSCLSNLESSNWVFREQFGILKLFEVVRVTNTVTLEIFWNKQIALYVYVSS